MGIVAGQDATISVINYSEQKSDVIRCKHSPATSLIPISDTSFLAICYDRNIIEYGKEGDSWKIKKTITEKGSGAQQKAKSSIVSAQLEKFQKMGNINKDNLAVSTKQAGHLHQSLISSANIKGKDMITTDVSGFIKYWKL